MLSHVDPYLEYLLIWLPVTEKLNPFLFLQLALILSVEGGSKPLQLALLCARAEARCREVWTLVCISMLWALLSEETDSPLHWQFLDFCSAISYAFMSVLS